MQNKEKKEKDKKFDSGCSEDYPESDDDKKKLGGEKKEIMTITMCERKSTIVCEKEYYFKLKH